MDFSYCCLVPHRLSLGPASVAQYHFSKLAREGITHVLNVGNDPCLTVPQGARHQFVECICIPCIDSPSFPIADVFPRIIDFLAPPDRHTFVHCGAGLSRGPTICLAFLVGHMRISLQDAWALVKRARPSAQPNFGFWQELLQLEREVLNTSSMTMFEYFRDSVRDFIGQFIDDDEIDQSFQAFHCDACQAFDFLRQQHSSHFVI